MAVTRKASKRKAGSSCSQTQHHKKIRRARKNADDSLVRRAIIQQQKKKQDVLPGCMSIDVEELRSLELEWEVDASRCKLHLNLTHAVLAYYLNSGYGRFDEHLCYSFSHAGKPVDTDKIKDEIAKEAQSAEELKKGIQTYFKAYSFHSRLLGCGACGIRQFESDNDSASIQYKLVRLSSLPEVYKYTATQQLQLDQLKQQGPLEIPDERGATSIMVEPWKVVSHYVSSVAGNSSGTYHLHPELVTLDEEEGVERTYLCPRCSKECNVGKCFKLSIAKGVDFGNFERLKGLGAPNLHEQMILSKNRLYAAMIKIFPNGQGFQRMPGMNRMCGNQILFSHDCVTKVDHKMITTEDLDAILKVHFYNEKGRDDAMARRAYGTSKLYARTSVLRQWFALLARLSPYYQDINHDIVENLMGKVEQSVKGKMKNPIFINDAQSLAHEKALGSDVAGIQQVDSKSSNYNDNYFSASPTDPICDDLPLKTHYVSPSPDTMLRRDEIRERVENDAIENMITCMDDRSTSHPSAAMVNQEQMRSDQIVRGWFGRHEEDGEGQKDACVISHRSQDPMDEFMPNDQLLASTFPWLFPLGKAYGKCPGNLNGEQLDHLLKQFNMIHGRDRRMLGYLADVKRRLEVIRNASFKLSGHSNAVSSVNKFMNSKDHQKILKTLKEDPNSALAKKVWNSLKSTFSLVGGSVTYGALESSRCISQTTETAKRYGAGCTFLTLSLDDVFNPRGIRAAIKTVSNTKFPAVFGNTSEYTTLDEFVAAIRGQAIHRGQGIICFDEGEGMRFERAFLSKLAAENPAAYVAETKSILNHVLSILVGCSPEGYFGAYDGPSTRKSHYWKTKKGIFGHILSFAGVVEDHVKGTLHFHIILFGSLTSYVLQELCQVPTICEKVAQVLDTFYKAKFTTRTNFRNVLTRQLKSKTALRHLAEPISPPALLQRTNPIGALEGQGTSSEASIMQKLENVTANERASNLFHVHHRTCHKGFHGRKRCRFAKKSGTCNRTHCVLLEPVTKNEPDNQDAPPSAVSQEVETNSGGFATNEDDYDEDDDDDNSMERFENEEQQQYDKQKEERGTMFASSKTLSNEHEFRIGVLEPISVPTYHLKDPLDRSAKKRVIVWELDRPVPKSIEENGSSSTCDLQGILELPVDSENLTREAIIENLGILLEHEAGTSGYPYNKNSEIWTFCKDENLAIVKAFYVQCVEALHSANQYVVDHNIPLSYCTGSHNNAVLLGGAEQSKAAMFYIAPYMAKEKASLAVCLTVLEQARKDVLKYKSKAADVKTKPEERLAKYFISKVTNKLNAYTELSDYQVVAYLLRVPSIITSEIFHYSEPWGAINYREKLIRAQTSDEQEVEDDVYLGYIQKFTIEKRKDGNDDIKMALPVVAMYFHRGKELKHLNLYEYNAFIQVKVLPERVTKRSKWFNFEGEFDLQARFGQTLCAKQRTLIFKGKVPRYPGKQPQQDHPTYSSWQKRADLYANYILTMFRPSKIYQGFRKLKSTTQEGHNWKHLMAWIESLQQDKSVVSKFRLMVVDRRMNCLVSDFQTKKMLSEYRAREADVWLSYEQKMYKRDQQLATFYERESDLAGLEDHLFTAKYDELDKRAKKVAVNMNADAESFAESASIISQEIRPCGYTNKLRSYHAELVTSQWQRRCSFMYDKNVTTTGRGTDDDILSLAELEQAGVDDHSIPSRLAHDSDMEATNATTSLNRGQAEIIDTYKDYLQNPDNPSIIQPPPVVLLTGKGGTGKSFVIHELLKLGNTKQTKTVWTMANNNLNAADIDGSTIASLLKQGINQKRTEAMIVQRKISNAAIEELEKQNVMNARLIIVDEISNITSTKLGELSRLFGVSRHKPDKYFGGIPVLLVGDFNQKEPVGGILATTRLMKNLENERICYTKSKKTPSITPPSLVDANAHNVASDSTLGCNILSSARWFEFTEAERSKDQKHNNNINRLYNGKPIDVGRLGIGMFKEALGNGAKEEEQLGMGMYKIYNNDSLKEDTPDEQHMWLRAPVIVKTNRERCTINYSRGLQFAKARNAVLVRWLSEYDKWEGQPPDQNDVTDTIANDAAFWEIFVAGGPCYLIDTVSKKSKLCNGTRAEYNSLVLSETQMDAYDTQRQQGQNVVTLTEPPIGINITVSDKRIMEAGNWSSFDTHMNANGDMQHVVVPIRQGCPKSRERQMFIKPPNLLLSPSRVTIKPTFPLAPGFAITVDKAQGQTLDRVILAISERQHQLSNFTYACVYVGSSRVKESGHLRLLLHTRPNSRLEWETLKYITALKPAKSNKAFFQGFSENRSDWKNDPWNQTKALARFLK